MLAFAVLAGPLALAAEPNRARADLAARVAAIIEAPEFKPSQWGMLVVDLESGEVLFERNPDKLIVPASVTKLFSCAAAATTLGCDYRFKTPVYITVKPNEAGETTGDLILVAQGDLTLGGRAEANGRIAFTNADHTYSGFLGKTVLTTPDPLAGVKSLAEQTAKSGVKRIRGEVLVDDRLFDHAISTGSGPEQVTPVLVNDNMIDFTITPGEVGGPAVVDWRPKSPSIAIDASVSTGPADRPATLAITRDNARRFTIRGQIPFGAAPQVVSRETAQPASTARIYLIEALRDAGVQVEAATLADNPAHRLPSADAYREFTKTAELESPPLAENLKLILKVSHNLHASTLPLLLAVHHGERSLAAGLKREATALTALGVDVATISFGGGAGGSRSDYVDTARDGAVAASDGDAEGFSQFLEALPILGVAGTLAEAVDADSPARGHVRAKTGTLLVENGLTGGGLCTSKALAGYLTDSHGRKRAFAFFVNNVPVAAPTETKRIGRVLGKLCETFHQAGE